jgi:transposase
LAPTIEAWLDHVLIRVNKSYCYSSWTFIHNNVEGLKWSLNGHDKVAIIYLGEIVFSRIALTKEQIERYSLPSIRVNKNDVLHRSEAATTPYTHNSMR